MQHAVQPFVHVTRCRPGCASRERDPPRHGCAALARATSHSHAATRLRVSASWARRSCRFITTLAPSAPAGVRSCPVPRPRVSEGFTTAPAEVQHSLEHPALYRKAVRAPCGAAKLARFTIVIVIVIVDGGIFDFRRFVEEAQIFRLRHPLIGALKVPHESGTAHRTQQTRTNARHPARRTRAGVRLLPVSPGAFLAGTSSFPRGGRNCRI